MRYLLDTQAFTWMDSSSEHLSNTVRQLILDPHNQLFLSLASVWEMQIKHQLGRLQLRLPLSAIVAEQQYNGIQSLPVEMVHIYELDKLPLHHRDPFDRMLIAQTRVAEMILISSDSRFTQYDVSIVWS